MYVLNFTFTLKESEIHQFNTFNIIFQYKLSLLMLLYYTVDVVCISTKIML